jgi:thymidylate kinase
VQKGFLNIAKDKKNYFIIDSNENNIEENSQIIIKKIKKLVS